MAEATPLGSGGIDLCDREVIPGLDVPHYDDLMGRWLSAVLVPFVIATCGGVTAPSPADQATFTITADGVTPKEFTINRNNRVSFLNRDSRPHRVMSAPHPQHTGCPAINLPTVNPGERVESGILTEAQVCGFHDELSPDDQSLHGKILIGVQ
jgi:hypothetical protein